MALTPDVREEINQLITQRGLPVDDFQISKKDVTKTAPYVYEISETVSVTRLTKRVMRRYQTEESTVWLTIFAADLSNGVFD